MSILDQYVTTNFWYGMQNFVIALIVLLIGWIIAKIIAGVVEKGLRKSGLDEKLFKQFHPEKPFITF